MRGLAMIGAAALVAGVATGCASVPGTGGGWGAPSFAALQQQCGAQPLDYGRDEQPVYSAVLDAYVARRHGRISQDQFCGFQSGLAQHYTTLATSSDPQARNQWVAFFNGQRANAIHWRSAVDPTLRGY
ncbi:hypothetical protein CY652_15060 [Burkholderia sp. WAC0059]|nr:hypothetical protein [Burkholderia sp. WAC0059]PLZ01720.1 hypothetical protein CY652_15060 [Burkholderia sp. WAC0059]